MGIFDIITGKKKRQQEAERLEMERKEKLRLEEQKRQEEYRRIDQERAERQRKLNREKFLQKKKDDFAQLLESLQKVEINLSSEKVLRNKQIDCDFETKNLTKSTSANKLKTFIAFDTETTGLKTGGNDIVELSAVKFVDFEPKELFTTLIKPRNPMPKEASEINGITDEMLENAPKFSEIVKSFEEFIGDFPLVAHNATFDMRFAFVCGVSSIIEHTVYDTLALSKKLSPDSYSHKLSDMCEEYGILFGNAHRASADALATGLLFVEFIKEKEIIE